MEINVLIEEGLEGYLEVSWLRSVVEQVLVAQDADFRVELGLVITNQERVQQLNRSYLGRNEPTDVLAFSMLPEPLTTGESEAFSPFAQPLDGMLHLGEVIISYPQAVLRAVEDEMLVDDKIDELVVHGLNNLIGKGG